MISRIRLNFRAGWNFSIWKRLSKKYTPRIIKVIRSGDNIRSSSGVLASKKDLEEKIEELKIRLKEAKEALEKAKETVKKLKDAYSDMVKQLNTAVDKEAGVTT